MLCPSWSPLQATTYTANNPVISGSILDQQIIKHNTTVLGQPSKRYERKRSGTKIMDCH